MQRLREDFGADVGDYLAVGPILLQLLPLPLLRHAKRHKQQQRQQKQRQMEGDLWDLLKSDGMPTRVGSLTIAVYY